MNYSTEQDTSPSQEQQQEPVVAVKRMTDFITVPRRSLQDVLLRELVLTIDESVRQLNEEQHHDTFILVADDDLRASVAQRVDEMHTKFCKATGRAEGHRAQDSLSMKLMSMLATLMTDKNISIHNTGALSKERSYEWMEKQILSAMTLVNACHGTRRENDAHGSEGVVREWNVIAWDLVRMLRNRPRAHVHRFRAAALLHIWIDVLLLRPVDTAASDGRAILDGNTRNTIGMLRGELYAKKTDSGDNKAAQLLTTAVDAILELDPEASDLVVDIMELMLTNPDLRMAYIVSVVVSKCKSLSTANKWLWCMEVHNRENALPSTMTIDRLLMECTISQDWSTGNDITRFIIDNKLPMDHRLYFRLISLLHASQSAKHALDMWHMIPDEAAKWHGLVLMKVLHIAVDNRQHAFWKQTVTEILQRAESQHEGQWPTGFFETRSQRDHFVRISHSIIDTLTHWGSKDKNGREQTSLADQWRRFMEDQLTRFESTMFGKDNHRRHRRSGTAQSRQSKEK